MSDLLDSTFAAFSAGGGDRLISGGVAEAHKPGGGFECAQRAERRQITVHCMNIPQAWLRNSRLQHQATLHISDA
jgi:hypothetical protein